MTGPANPAPAADAAPAPAGVDRRARRLIMWDGGFSRLMDVFTGGAFLAGLGLYVGMGNAQLGLLAALPFLAQVAQLPSLVALLHLRDRRRIVVACAGAARLLLVAVAALLLLRPGLLGAGSLLALLAVAAVLTVTSTAAWNWWMRDLLPPDQLGRFFGRRMMGTTWAALVAMLAAALFMDRMVGEGLEGEGYAALFAAGAACGLLGVALLWRTPHVEPPPSPPARRALHAMHEAWRTSPPLLVPTLSAIAAATTFSLPFISVFLLRSLGYPFIAVTGLLVLNHLAYLGALRAWGTLADRHGDRGVLGITLTLLCLCLAGWAAAGWSDPVALAAWVALLHVLAGLALGGIDIASTNLLLKSAPSGNAAAHLAFVSLARAGVAGVATVLAGLLWEAVGTGALVRLGGWDVRGFHLLSLGGLAIGLLALTLVVRLRSIPGAPVLEVTRAMRREVATLSSLAGMRALLHAISYSVELLAAPFAAPARRRRGGQRRTPGTGDGPLPSPPPPPPPPEGRAPASEPPS